MNAKQIIAEEIRYTQGKPRKRNKIEISCAELERLGIPVNKSGRPLTGKRLAEYYRNKYNRPT